MVVGSGVAARLPSGFLGFLIRAQVYKIYPREVDRQVSGKAGQSKGKGFGAALRNCVTSTIGSRDFKRP